MAQALTKARLLPNLKLFRQNVLRAGDVANTPGRATPVGLCVSGGPDSMALASLMGSLRDVDLGFPIQPVGLIIDHARSGSADEAESVRGELAKLGIPARIERLNWQTNDPLHMTNFETAARVHRYRVFAFIAQELGIRHLFFGHHRDDQIETLIMRLIQHDNLSFLGLQGMAEAGPIPAAVAAYGVRNEIPPVQMNNFLCCGIATKRPLDVFRAHASDENPLLTFTTRAGKILGLRPGGINIYRPLLEFNKTDLIATCQANSVPYIMDKTNEDPQFTTRNAVRYLRGHGLPRALQDRSISHLIETSRKRSASLQARILGLLRRISVIVLDLRSAMAIIRLPGNFAELAIDDKAAVAGALAQICQLVSPEPVVKAGTLAPEEHVDNLTQRLQANLWQSLDDRDPQTFQCSKVHFEGLPPANEQSAKFYFWRLSRQTMRPEEIRDCQMRLSSASPDNSRNDFSSPWLLWDNRFWFRITSTDPSLLGSLTIRPFREKDWGPLRKQLPKHVSKSCQATMIHHAPGKIRYSLPVLCFKNSVIAFPTLNDSDHIFESRALKEWCKDCGYKKSPRVTWQTCYKVLPERIDSWGTAE